MKLLKDHGTKLIGGLTTLVGSLSAIDPTILGALLGQKGLSYFTAVAGILTILRGVQNSKAAPK